MSAAGLRSARWWAVAVLAAGLVGWWSQSAGGAQRAGATHRSTRSGRSFSVTAWLPYWEMRAALRSTLGHAAVIGTASPYWYAVSGDSRVQPEAGAGSPAVIAGLAAEHEQLVPMVTEEPGISAFAAILASRTRRATLVRTLVRLGAHPGFAGLDIDFESFAYDPRHRAGPADELARDYPAFLAEVCRGLHAIGRSCQVAVMARTSDARTYSHGDIASWIYDYRALAAAADRVQIMAYDDHSPGGLAGPIAPLPWVRRVIAYARTQGRPAGFELGLPAYGYDWYGRTSATAVYAGQLADLAAASHARIVWNPTDAEETLRYRVRRVRHTVWVVDARADAERAQMAAAAGFSGVAVWAAGYEQPELWTGLDLRGPR